MWVEFADAATCNIVVTLLCEYRSCISPEEAVNSDQLCFNIPWLAVTGCSQNPRDAYAKVQRESITGSNDSNAQLAIHEAGIA